MLTTREPYDESVFAKAEQKHLQRMENRLKAKLRHSVITFPSGSILIFAKQGGRSSSLAALLSPTAGHSQGISLFGEEIS